MTESCRHGYVPGMCPKGCNETADASIPPEPVREPVWEEPVMEAKLKCVICGQDVERGIVYKGRPLCGACMKDLGGKKEMPGTIGGYTKELAEKKFPMQGNERLSAKDIKTPPE